MSRSNLAGYPVLEERALDPVPRRGMLGGRRDPLELPRLVPGTAYVFEVDGEFRQPLVRRHVRGTEHDVVHAVSVCLVDTRPRLIPIELVIASGSAEHDFVVRATFRCRVTDAAAAVAAGVGDVPLLLGEHLTRDRGLLGLGTYFGLDRVGAARARIHTQVRAYCMVAPPRLPGLEVVLATVDVRARPLNAADELPPPQRPR